MSHPSSRWSVLTTLMFAVALTACGGSSGGSPTTGATSLATAPPVAVASRTAATVPPLSTLTTTAAAPSCPSPATVDAALGTSLPAPVGIAGAGGTPLPAGATAVVCEYRGTAYNVIMTLISNIDPSYISKFSANFPVPYTTVSGVGDQARSFSVSLGGGKDNEGVVATKGSTLVALVATATPASLAQIEALINQLL